MRKVFCLILWSTFNIAANMLKMIRARDSWNTTTKNCKKFIVNVKKFWCYCLPPTKDWLTFLYTVYMAVSIAQVITHETAIKTVLDSDGIPMRFAEYVSTSAFSIYIFLQKSSSGLRNFQRLNIKYYRVHEIVAGWRSGSIREAIFLTFWSVPANILQLVRTFHPLQFGTHWW